MCIFFGGAFLLYSKFHVLSHSWAVQDMAWWLRNVQACTYGMKVNFSSVFLHDQSLFMKKDVTCMLFQVARAAKLNKFEIPSKIRLLSEPWTPESGLVTAALKLKREQIKTKFKDELQTLYEWIACLLESGFSSCLPLENCKINLTEIRGCFLSNDHVAIFNFFNFYVLMFCCVLEVRENQVSSISRREKQKCLGEWCI